MTQIPLYDHQDNIVAIEEVALSVDSLKAAKRHTMLILGICTLVIAGAGAFLGSIIAGRLIEPLQKLTDSVINISQGDLDTPIPIPESPNEISTLAIALDNSRCNTLSIIDNLSRSNSWWKTLIRSIPDGIITIDNQERITAFNSGAEVITGWKSDEAMRLGINRVLQIPEREAGFTGNIQIGGGPQQICILNRKGQEVILSVTGSRTERTDENISQTTYVLRDITEEEIAQRLRSHFLRNITKEFQTPLIVLNTSIERLMGEIRDLSRSEIFDLLNSIHFNVSGLQGLIDNLFESTNVIAEFSQLHRRPTDLRDIVTEAARIIQPLLNRRNQTLSQDIGKDLPLVNVDQNRLSQALVNLLLNASKFSPAQGKITLIVNIKDNQSLYIAVQDQGAGISPTDRPNLFRPFVGLGDLDDSEYQVQLGLSVVRSIVEKHGGELGVDPRDGEGSTFWINIPLD